MRRLGYSLALTILLSACAHTPILPPAKGIPSLSEVARSITQGMVFTDVELKMAGNKPALRYTANDSAIWEYRDRKTTTKESVQTERFLVKFDPQGKVTYTSGLDPCLVPELPPSNSASGVETHCYQKMLFPFEKQVVFDAIKRLLINSHFQIEHTDALSEVISATGVQPVPEDDDKTMIVKLSMMYRAQGAGFSEVVVSATFSMTERRSQIVEIGGAGVTLPVPLPFRKREEWAETGLVPPKYYLNLYDALTSLIANEFQRYTPLVAVPAASQPAATLSTGNVATTPEASSELGVSSRNPGSISDTELLDDLADDGRPIDQVMQSGLKKKNRGRPIDAPGGEYGVEMPENPSGPEEGAGQTEPEEDRRPIDQVLAEQKRHKKTPSKPKPIDAGY